MARKNCKLSTTVLFMFFFHAFLLQLVLCDDDEVFILVRRIIQHYLADEEDNLLQGLNSYRHSLQLSPFTKNKQAGCLADELADEIKDHPCVSTVAANAIIPGGAGTQFSNYPKLLKKCSIDPNTTSNGIILPVCVPKMVLTLVLTNYTRTGFARYVNDSRFTGAGLGSEDDWMVLVLATSSVGGSFASSAIDVVYGLINYFLPFVAGLFLV